MPVALVDSLLSAIIRADGDALVMHVGERPYVVAPSGQSQLASRQLTLEALKGMLNELLPVDARRALDELRAEHVKMALLTNKPLEASVRILDALRLAEYFRMRVGGDGPWPRKPAPDGLWFLMKEESAGRADTVLVGDSTVDLQTARNAGVRICLARYGFGFANLPSDALRGDELIVDRPSDVAGAVR